MPWKRKSSSIIRRQEKRAEAVKNASDTRPSAVGGAFLIVAVLLLGGLLVFVIVRRQARTDAPVSNTVMTPRAEVMEKPSKEQAEDWDRFEREAMKVAQDFLAEADTEQRLKLAREAEVVRNHLFDYAPQARSMVAKDVSKLAVKMVDGERMASFAVMLEDGSVRLLNVVEEDGRLLVDWDSYARYSSVAWDVLLGENSFESEAMVRVFVQPGEYHNPPFEDPSVWTSFRLVTPDVNRPLYAFAKADSEIAQRMRGLVMRSGNLRQHMTLSIKRHAGPYDKILFSVEEIVAVGWVVK